MVSKESIDFAALWLGANVGKGELLTPESAEAKSIASTLEGAAREHGFSRNEIEQDDGSSLESMACFVRSIANSFELRPISKK